MLFPHVNVKNCKVAVNLGFYPEETEDWKIRLVHAYFLLIVGTVRVLLAPWNVAC